MSTAHVYGLPVGPFPPPRHRLVRDVPLNDGGHLIRCACGIGFAGVDKFTTLSRFYQHCLEKEDEGARSSTDS